MRFLAVTLLAVVVGCGAEPEAPEEQPVASTTSAAVSMSTAGVTLSLEEVKALLDMAGLPQDPVPVRVGSSGGTSAVAGSSVLPDVSSALASDIVLLRKSR